MRWGPEKERGTPKANIPIRNHGLGVYAASGARSRSVTPPHTPPSTCIWLAFPPCQPPGWAARKNTIADRTPNENSATKATRAATASRDASAACARHRCPSAGRVTMIRRRPRPCRRAARWTGPPRWRPRCPRACPSTCCTWSCCTTLSASPCRRCAGRRCGRRCCRWRFG